MGNVEVKSTGLFSKAGSIHEVKETTVKKTNGVNTNVILTDFEKSVLEKLSTDNNKVLISDIYGMVKHEHTTEEGDIVNNKFLSLKGKFINAAGIPLYVTVVIRDNSRFYLSLGNAEIKERTGKDLFVNHLLHMQEIIKAMTGGAMTEENISDELSAINNFGA